MAETMKEYAAEYWLKLAEATKELDKMPSGDVAADIRKLSEEIRRTIQTIDMILDSNTTGLLIVVDRKMADVDHKFRLIERKKESIIKKPNPK
jgi:hypothetical protein